MNPRRVNEITFELRRIHSKVTDKTHKIRLENANKIYENVLQSN